MNTTTASTYFPTAATDNNKYFLENNNLKSACLKTKVHAEDNSLFIPMLPSSMVNEEKLTAFIEQKLTLGKVRRIDLVAKPNTQNRYMAFIHFEYWFNSHQTNNFRELIIHNGHMDVYGSYECRRVAAGYSSMTDNIIDEVLYTDLNGRKCYGIFVPVRNEAYSGVYVPTRDFYTSATTYVRFMMNKTPIPETELNPHQLANNLALAEKEIQDLKTRLAQLEETIKKITGEPMDQDTELPLP
jgi:hypothetical protein